MYKVVRKSEGTVREIADNKIAINYITKDITPDVSLAVIEGKNYNAPIIAEQNWIYFILEGKMKLNFVNEEITLQVGDSCFVSKGEKYQMIGTYKSIIVCQPAFST